MKTRFPCAGQRELHTPTRRDFLFGLGASIGSVAFSSLLASELETVESSGPLAPKKGHFPAKTDYAPKVLLHPPQDPQMEGPLRNVIPHSP